MYGAVQRTRALRTHNKFPESASIGVQLYCTSDCTVLRRVRRPTGTALFDSMKAESVRYCTWRSVIRQPDFLCILFCLKYHIYDMLCHQFFHYYCADLLRASTLSPNLWEKEISVYNSTAIRHQNGLLKEDQREP